MNKDDVTITYTNDDGTSGSYVVPGDQWEVAYDSQGRRLSKEYHKAPALHNPNFPVALVCQIDESYDYVGDQLVAIRDHMGTSESIITFTYDMFGPATLTYNGTTYYYLRNAQGDIMGISDEEGNQLVAYTYDAWGKPLSITGTMATTLGEANPFRYRGYFYDDETGFYYLQSRYYDPEIGRFISVDGYVQTPGKCLVSTNGFSYCQNDPINNYDYTGEFPVPAIILGAIGLKEIAAAIIGLIGAIIVTDFIISNPPKLPSISLPEADVKPKVEDEEKVEEKVVPKRSDNSVFFPANPNDFNPVGLVKVPRPGTKNGRLISWMDPLTNIEVFRWDENLNYPNGPHYHIYGRGHFYAGDRVPEPFASIYFPFRP